MLHIITMNITELSNSTVEHLFTTNSQTMHGSYSEDVSHSSSAGGLWTTETMAALIPIVTDSVWEQAITAGLLLIFGLYVNISNGCFFHVIRKEHSLHTPQYMVLASYMLSDTLYCNFTLLHMLAVVISNDIQVMSATLFRIIMAVISSFLLSSFHLVGLLAYERYCYFVTPLRYPLKFTKSRIFVAVALIYSCALSITLAVDLTYPRMPVATILAYQAVGRAMEITHILHAAVYVIPSAVISLVTLIKLRLVISKQNAQIQPAQSMEMNEDQTCAVTGIIVKPVRKALKMVALVSGSFWMTVIPGALIRTALQASGVTWADTDHRVYLPYFALSRASYLMVTVLSSVLNPVVYLSVLTELREAVWKRIGIKRNDTPNQRDQAPN